MTLSIHHATDARGATARLASFQFASRELSFFSFLFLFSFSEETFCNGLEINININNNINIIINSIINILADN